MSYNGFFSGWNSVTHMYVSFICSPLTDFYCSVLRMFNLQPSTFTRIGDDQRLMTTSFQDGIALHSGGQDCVHDLGKFFINQDWTYVKRQLL